MPATFFSFQAVAAVLTGLLVWKLFDKETGLTRECIGVVNAVGWMLMGLMQLKRWWSSSNSNKAIWSRSAYCAVVVSVIATALTIVSTTAPHGESFELLDGLLLVVSTLEVAAVT